MPSPFPGMDPYLESRLYWRGFHELFISAMTASLNATLPEGFAANVDERLYVSWEERTVYPDVAIIEQPSRRILPSGGVSVADAPLGLQDEALEIDLMANEERESYIEVLRLGTHGTSEQVVSVIEVLSPVNKVSLEGREEYRRKQQSTLRSAVHLLEIDLLREGPHTVAVPANSIVRPDGIASDWDYIISLHYGSSVGRFSVWPRTLREPLPHILLPLAGDSPGVLLNLQAAFDRAYDSGPYRRRIDYSADPESAVSPDDAAWLDQLLREKNLRA